MNTTAFEKLPQSFYVKEDVVTIARHLLGKLLCTCMNGQTTIARIMETEAYNGVHDKASHAYGGKRTSRTEVMYATGGVAYVYLCYGIHHLFNVVTGKKGIPQAVLIRTVAPVLGHDTMSKRRGKKNCDSSIGTGPGNVSKALGIVTAHTGLSLLQNQIFLADDGVVPNFSEMVCTPRIGVDYAAEDALLPYRFFIGNQSQALISGTKLQNQDYGA